MTFNASKQVNVFKNFKLSMPAYMVMVAYVILLVVVMLPIKIPMQDPRNPEKIVVVSYPFYQRMLLVILMTIPVILSVYSLNCMMVGQCELYSYLTAGLTVFWVILALLAIILANRFV